MSVAKGVITAAAREVFEESGVLLASAPDGGAPVDELEDHWAAEREAVATRRVSFGEFLRERGLVLRSDLMRLRSHWVTPESEARRYDTYFFLARLPEGQHADGRTSEAV
ncbi:MAG: NUDIX hydrolase, partial [Adlercreutzia sp.]